MPRPGEGNKDGHARGKSKTDALRGKSKTAAPDCEAARLRAAPLHIAMARLPRLVSGTSTGQATHAGVDDPPATPRHQRLDHRAAERRVLGAHAHSRSTRFLDAVQLAQQSSMRA